jgi:hypothetical protein
MKSAGDTQTDRFGKSASATKTAQQSASARGASRSEIDCKRTVTAACDDVDAESRFIRREDADAFPATGNAHVPLLRVGCGAHCRVAKEHVIDCLALRL